MTEPKPPQVSIWTRGAQASTVICVLIWFANNRAPMVELVGSLVTSFVIWWVICAGVVWVFRKLKR